MSDIPSRRRGEPRTRFDDSGRKALLWGFIAIGALFLLWLIALAVSARLPDVGLTLQFGGLPRASSTEPRNFRLWAVQPDGKLRFATVFYPARNNAPASEVFTVAGPLVDSPGDVLETRYFGAMNINSQVQSGQGNDSTRFYNLYWLEHDPQTNSYGVDVLTQNPPYIAADPKDKSANLIAMGAPQQTYYAQVIVAIAFSPGTKILDIAYPIPDPNTGELRETMLVPYRRASLDGWTVYYFDQTSLTAQGTVRIKYQPPGPHYLDVPGLNLFQVDRMR